VTSDFINQIYLPLALATMMYAMGLGLKVQDFKNLLRRPKAIGAGLLMQLSILPAVAWLIIFLFDTPTELSAGLILIAMAPGGATSNAISAMCKGDVALAISLTAIIAVITPFTIPIFLNWHYQWLDLSNINVHIPLLETIFKLCLITLLPVLLGMMTRHFFERFILAAMHHVKLITALVFISLILLMVWANFGPLCNLYTESKFGLMTLSVLSLCGASMFAAHWGSHALGLSTTEKRSISCEVGIQNAGTAMMIAATIMHQPALAIIALVYGLAMNIPAAFYIFSCRYSNNVGSGALNVAAK